MGGRPPPTGSTAAPGFQNLQAIETGQIKPVDPSNFAMSLIGMCIFPIIAGPIAEKMFPGTKVNEKKYIENRKKEIFNLIWNGIKVD